MTTLYLVRHGTTHMNLEQRWQGCIDSELAPIGIEEAERESKVLERRVAFDAAYTSDLARARRTCEILCRPHGITPVDAPALREPSLGRFEGMTKHDILTEHGDLIDALDRMPNDERVATPYFDGLETPIDVARRVRAFVDELRPLHDGQTVLLVTHSIVLQSLLAVWGGHRYENIGMRWLAWIELAVDADGAVEFRHLDGFCERSVRES
jgi:broad specificity phosphatase PhoE